MNKEIEAKLHYKNKEEIIKVLKSTGARKKTSTHINDVYYGTPGSTMNNTNSLTRVRIKNSESELTFKEECKNQNNVWERVELNVKIDNPENMKIILDKIGLEKISENESIREMWLFDDCELIFIDYIKPENITMIEIEGPSHDAVNCAISKLGSLVEKIGEEAFVKFEKNKKKKDNN
jgi:predicted adenylyl cyclase CyaB